MPIKAQLWHLKLIRKIKICWLPFKQDLCQKQHCFLNYLAINNTALAQLSPYIFDQRKMDDNFLETNFEYFRLSTARDDRNNQNCPSSFFRIGLKCC